MSVPPVCQQCHRADLALCAELCGPASRAALLPVLLQDPEADFAGARCAVPQRVRCELLTHTVALVAQCILLNGVVFLGSIYFMDKLLLPSIHLLGFALRDYE